ncbi:acid phosphatase [Noviherbaspirillum galbum]|uniref:Acid phosphatase n=1 Tax=Noviherbaspirillum galbum TaxID=2709383 RepID=A0A6B3SQ43_9BURK|nr:acid phosphatase [Noviherbaspirillum galbum]NEX62894.1 acid phosphatase [Noviherbaspirillum galbum]
MNPAFRLLWVSGAIAVAGCAMQQPATDAKVADSDLRRIENIVVIYAENHSFDNMYGMFPGANGVANATAQQKTQLDHDGKPLATLPPVYDSHGQPIARFPRGLPNGPFRIDAPPVGATFDQILPNPIHNFYQNIEQINGGRNDMFVAMTNVGAWNMGYYDGSSLKVWRWAREYTLADNFFMGAFGGSFLNHQWLVCACSPVYKDAPANLRAQLDDKGRLRKKPSSPASVMDGPVQAMDGTVTPDGFVVNTSQPPYQPSGIPPGSDPALADPAKHPVPPQVATTIGDTLSSKGVSWAWYSGAWNAANADGRQPAGAKRQVIGNREPSSPNFQTHHQPFNYFKRFAPGTADRERHLKDADDMMRAIDEGNLPQVTFYKPPGRLTQHPSYTDIRSGDEHIADVLERLRRSPQWGKMAVIVTYDENGGYWDHVPPPSGAGWGDRWGPGTRIPTLVISPFAKRGHVDHVTMDTTSILKFITRRFELEPLPGVRKNMGDLTSAFDFAQQGR